jgi:hypothetical protein
LQRSSTIIGHLGHWHVESKLKQREDFLRENRMNHVAIAIVPLSKSGRAKTPTPMSKAVIKFSRRRAAMVILEISAAAPTDRYISKQVFLALARVRCQYMLTLRIRVSV